MWINLLGPEGLLPSLHICIASKDYKETQGDNSSPFPDLLGVFSSVRCTPKPPRFLLPKEQLVMEGTAKEP